MPRGSIHGTSQLEGPRPGAGAGPLRCTRVEQGPLFGQDPNSRSIRGAAWMEEHGWMRSAQLLGASWMRSAQLLGASWPRHDHRHGAPGVAIGTEDGAPTSSECDV